MIILYYFISIIIFFVAEMIISALIIPIYSIIASLIIKDKNPGFWFSTHFLSTFFGVFFASMIALYSFSWFNVSPKYYIAIPIYGALSLFAKPNASIKPEMQPKAQKLGSILGIISILIYFFIVSK